MDRIRVVGWGLVVVAALAAAIAGFYTVRWWDVTTPGSAMREELMKYCALEHRYQNARLVLFLTERHYPSPGSHPSLHTSFDIEERCTAWVNAAPFYTRWIKWAGGAAVGFCVLGVLLLTRRRPKPRGDGRGGNLRQ